MQIKKFSVKKILRWLCRSRTLLFYDNLDKSKTQNEVINPPSEIPFIFQFANEVKVKEFCNNFVNKQVWQFYLNSVQKGSFAFIVWHNDVLAHRSLAIKGPSKIRVPGYGNLHVKENEFYISHCETNETYRGNGLYPFAIHSLANKVVSENLSSRIYIVTDLENLASQRGILKAGFSHKKTKSRFALFGARISFPIPNKCHI